MKGPMVPPWKSGPKANTVQSTLANRPAVLAATGEKELTALDQPHLGVLDTEPEPMVLAACGNKPHAGHAPEALVVCLSSPCGHIIEGRIPEGNFPRPILPKPILLRPPSTDRIWHLLGAGINGEVEFPA